MNTLLFITFGSSDNKISNELASANVNVENIASYGFLLSQNPNHEHLVKSIRENRPVLICVNGEIDNWPEKMNSVIEVAFKTIGELDMPCKIYTYRKKPYRTYQFVAGHIEDFKEINELIAS